MREEVSNSNGAALEAEAEKIAVAMQDLLPREQRKLWGKFAGWTGWAVSMGGIGIAQMYAAAHRVPEDTAFVLVNSTIVSAMVWAVIWKHYEKQWREIAPKVERFRKRMGEILHARSSLVIRAHAESVGVHYPDLRIGDQRREG